MTYLAECVRMKSEAGSSDCTEWGEGGWAILHHSNNLTWVKWAALGPDRAQISGKRHGWKPQQAWLCDGFDRTTSETELKRSRPVMDTDGDEGEGSSAKLQGDEAFGPRVCLPSINITSRPLRALIVRRHVSHPISLSPGTLSSGNIYFRDTFITEKVGWQHLRKFCSNLLSSF